MVAQQNNDQKNDERDGVAVQAGLDHTALHPEHDPQASCTCATAALHHSWCRHCNVGFVAGVRITSAKLFETLDPHGHETMLESLMCSACRNAVSADGYCDVCRKGFVNQMAYFTRLTHGLAQGRVIDPATLSCAVCRSHVAEPGWCDQCGRGMVGNVAIADRRTFDQTAGEFRILRTAVDRSAVCEWCACAMVVHRTCLNCRISYELDESGRTTPQ